VSLTDAPPYVALSYHWGDPTPSHRVVCNGRLQSVTKSLAQALYTVVCCFRMAPIRRSGAADISNAGYAYIWADALCINQQDIDEKNSQIPMMGDIYSRASRVIGYLGRPRSGDPWLAVFGMISIGNAQDLSSVFGPEAKCEPFPDVPDSVAQDLGEFGSSPWFSRSWVTQEVLLAQDVLCLYGLGPTCAHCAFNILAALVSRVGSVEHHRSDIARLIPGSGYAATIVQLELWAALKHKRGTSCRGLDLVTVLTHTQDTEATDPRDKVFSIMGLLDDRSRSAIQVDYSEHTSAQQIYTEVAKYCIGTEDAIELLKYAGLTTHLPDLPTWVPDWSRKSRTALKSTLYKAAGSTAPSVSLLEGGSKISVRGIAFDLVAALSPAVAYPDGTISGVYSSPVSGSAAMIILDECARQFYSLFQPMHTRYPTQESLDEAILKTLTADRSWTNRRCTAEDRRYYQAWQAKYGPVRPTLSPSSSRNLNAPLNKSQVPSVSAGEQENPSRSEQLQQGDSPNESNRQSLREEFPVEVVSKVSLAGRRLCVTITGFLGLVPEGAEFGDVVAIFFGAPLPFVIRPVRDSAEFELVGHCYIHGAMDGEAIQSASTTQAYWDKVVADFEIR
jgi:hypothetical protein